MPMFRVYVTGMLTAVPPCLVKYQSLCQYLHVFFFSFLKVYLEDTNIRHVQSQALGKRLLETRKNARRLFFKINCSNTFKLLTYYISVINMYSHRCIFCSAIFTALQSSCALNCCCSVGRIIDRLFQHENVFNRLIIRSERIYDIYTGCPRRNVPDFGRVFLILKYTDITQNTYVQS